jgi:hypothetical protein
MLRVRNRIIFITTRFSDRDVGVKRGKKIVTGGVGGVV